MYVKKIRLTIMFEAVNLNKMVRPLFLFDLTTKASRSSPGPRLGILDLRAF